MALYCFINVLLRQRKNKAPETNAEQRSKTNIPIKPNIRSVSIKLKLGSGSKLKRLVKQSKWQIIDRQAIILCVKGVFCGFRTVNLFVVFASFLVDKKVNRYLNFTSCLSILGLPLARFNTALNIYFILLTNFSQISAALLRTTKLCHSVEVIFRSSFC
jgi:hypothetical protein